ncbi:60S ribosomal protein L14 [Protomyces lactucae-debilis]|uniref:60S ribosomal protein L14 n=1 Tax=Protomyces lactucae-debilis TaxID=2754530 RepID=A0A1Y2F846_PROLT|nr:60S ribosomal protein L14 [Protomyces lactucae-debilis]ORY79095.1 60S ribosomal protein L14 [Protomyces lactucae-debilis]
MAAAQIDGFKRFVEVGRVVYFTNGPYTGKLAVISEIIDHNRALIDGPETEVPRHVASYNTLTLTPYIVAGLPRSAKSTAVSKFWKKSGVQAKFDASAYAKKLAARKTRAGLSDFQRFQVMKLRKQRKYEVAVKASKA